jgi:hypothetical protein
MIARTSSRLVVWRRLFCAVAAAVGVDGFSSPTVSLPDVVISDSFVAKSEGDSFTYTVVLSHPPGMREDETIDLLNDEVRIYLTSSQEVLQQDDVSGSVEWQQRRNHRTQLRIYTNDITNSGSTGTVSGPLPYVYVAYSTVNPLHASLVSGGQYTVVCPLPTHPAYAELTDVIITDTVIAAAGGAEAFDGCYQIKYNGFAPVLDACAASSTDLVTSCDDRHQGTATCTETAAVSDANDAATCAAVTGLDLLTPAACEAETVCTYTGGSPDSGSHYARTGSTYPEPAHAVFTSAAKAACVANLPAACSTAVSGFDGVANLLTVKAAGGGGVDGGGSDNSVSGDSDYRIYSDGSAVARDVVDGANKCRYCGAPGLFCDTAGNDGPGTGCPVVTVNGGDQQPEEPNWLYPTYQSGPSWRGDLSSSAQLIFDSTNWDVPQTVQVTVRNDDVFEPDVHNRGQDAVVHHYVVAQDINLQHTYYEDIGVNDLVVSITDDDPAILIESAKLVPCTEDPLDDCSIAYRLASEPLYDVTVYLQSGNYFDPATPVPTVDTARPDDEQVIFQDIAQYNTCYDFETGLLLDDCTDARARRGCAINGRYVTLVSGRVNQLPEALPTGPLRESFECARQATSEACLSHAGSGCVWNDPDCEVLSDRPYTAKDITCSTFTDDGQATCEAYDSCDWDADTSACLNVKYGYDCRSYMFFTSTNWNTFQTMKVIGVPDFVDEVATESAVGVLMESRDWYYNSVGSRLMQHTKTDYRPTVDGVLWGEQYLTQTACEARDNTATAAANELEPITCTWDAAASSCTCTVARGMFDTRKGVHNPRYVRLSTDTDLYAVDPAVDGSTPSLSYIQSNWGPSFAKASPRLSSGVYPGAYHEVDANNIAACCQDATDGSVRTIQEPADPLSTLVWPDEPRVYDPDDLTQVVAFTPSEYQNNGVYEGAIVRIAENPTSPGRGVTISRTNCEATEGRRYWFDKFEAHPTPVGTLDTTFGLFTGEGSVANTAATDAEASLPIEDGGDGDGWTMVDVPAASTGYADMTAPVCPYTIVLDSAPTEGRTAVVSLREDVELSTLRDHELYFYEEPTYRSDESGSDVTESECGGIGGSDWVNGACFINNVPCFAPDTTDWSHSNRRKNAAGDTACEEGDVILARGSTDLDVMFTEADWNIPRRITAIALNDDVDEPTEIRTIYHSVTPCSGYNHNTMIPCMEDPTYTNEVPAASVDVRVVDNDIADLVVICGDGYTSGYDAATIDEFFIGSYDMSGPSSGNTWYENFERAGPDAEDGISGSEFGGSITQVGGATDTVTTYTAQAADDGIGGGGHTGAAGANTDGYLTDLDDPLCQNFVGNPTLASSNPSPKCFNPTDVSWTHYDPFYDRYVAGGTAYSEFSRDTYGGTSVTIATHNRGFKGIGPATTEPEDEYACTIHSRECLNDVFGDDSDDGVDSLNAACVYGTFQVRLNSSPGTKHVRRQYVGEVDTTVDEELVYIVVSPDVTHQTKFDPPSVTFTHTGGTLADGQDTYRWDEPVTIKVVPVDDLVDERAGVIIDYTSFTITQSNFGEDYWQYTVPYQTDASTGTLKVANDAGTGRTDDHTPFRHHIRTIHTADNDYAGIRLESKTVSQSAVGTNPNMYSHDAVAVAVTEGGSFGFYSIRLDTQPRKPQRQAGTNPNNEITNAGSCDSTIDITGATSIVNAYTLPGYDDYSSYTRPNACGSIEHEEEYWVDVTVTQTIHVDLSVPESCPETAAWGGGSNPDHEYEHPRFPYNAKNDGTGYYRPINELMNTADDMDGYLTTCGGWQHDATYRFTASNWNVPQYVYLYAHNDRDAASTTGHVDLGGNEGAAPIDTTLKHYVETEDAPYNMRRAGYVQRNKHGGVYTQGNLERFPFGVIDSKHNRATGRTTFGFSTYHTLHEFVNPTTVPVPTVDCIGIQCMGQGSGDMCCKTTMGMVPVRGSINYDTRGTLGLAGYRSSVLHSNTCTGTKVSDSSDCSAVTAFVASEAQGDCPTGDGCVFTPMCPGYALPTDAADTCTESVTGTSMKQPWKDTGEPCRPLYSAGNLCASKYATTNTCTGTKDSDGSDCSAVTAFVASQAEADCPVDDGCVFTVKGGMRFPPNDVVVTVTDNDSAEDDTATSAAASAAANCRQTSLLQYTDSKFKISRKEWLTDLSCNSNDAGGLPGYPVANTDGAA